MPSSNTLVCWLLVLSFSCILQWATIDAGCLCHEKGTDYCNGEKCSERPIVRPKPRYYKPAPDLELNPIGDSCSCNKLLIEPALLPKPKPCKQKKPPPYPSYPPCGCKRPPPPPPPPPSYYPPSSESYYAPPVPKPYPKPEPYYSPPPPPEPPIYGTPLPPSSYAMPDVAYAPNKIKDDSPPADPISVSLALQASKAVQVPEAKLAYGFVQRPLDGLKKIYFSNVPEENLFKLNSEIITLKKRRPAPKEEEEEDIIEDEEEAEPDDGDDAPVLTYKQLGYAPEHFKNPKFREIYSPGGGAYEDEGKPLYGKVAVDCGFRPGRIATYTKVKPYKGYGSCY